MGVAERCFWGASEPYHGAFRDWLEWKWFAPHCASRPFHSTGTLRLRETWRCLWSWIWNGGPTLWDMPKEVLCSVLATEDFLRWNSERRINLGLESVTAAAATDVNLSADVPYRLAFLTVQSSRGKLRGVPKFIRSVSCRVAWCEI